MPEVGLAHVLLDGSPFAYRNHDRRGSVASERQSLFVPQLHLVILSLLQT